MEQFAFTINATLFLGGPGDLSAPEICPDVYV